ncbi:MAG: hypothetical protein JW768_02215 [Chitinispirillaceae bacterium]|nr:hypothetical protein [Chitinispirillaceae bacterium]
MKRMRGESFYRCMSSNTLGSGNIWISLASIGHVWDDPPLKTDDAGAEREGFWMFNARAFPEAYVCAGFFDVASVAIESRPLTWAFKMPGWVAGDLKLTWPNNKDLRLLGFGCNARYLYRFTNTTPTLGGYIGFMPEGYVTKGSIFEGKFLFDVDLISKMTILPLRFLINLGARVPLEREYINNYQFLGDVGVVYSGYDYDFFAAYSLEAFNNFTGPKRFAQAGDKEFLVWFSENPMYLVVGGNVRYKNGITLSVALPLLTSMNVESKMSRQDQTHLDQKRADLFPYEVSHDIRNPFDPWFVKWKIVGSLTFPLRYKMTSAEMMRNFLLLKNTKEKNRLDIDNRLRSFEESTNVEPEDDEEKRLEKIRKRKEEMKKQQE